MCVRLRYGEVSSFVLLDAAAVAAPSVVIVSLSAMSGRRGNRRTWRTEGVKGDCGSHSPRTFHSQLPGTPDFPVSRRSPFPPARIATAHWAARDHPRLDLIMQAHELCPSSQQPPSTCTTNPLRLAPLCLSTCFDSFASSSSFFPYTNCNHFTNNVESPLGRLVNITSYAPRRIVGLSAHSTQPPNRSLADIALICLSRCRYV